MTIIEQLARYLAAKLRMPFEDGVFFGYMPADPVKAVCVYANDLRAPGDQGGVRVQIAIRSDTDGAWPLSLAVEIMRLLDDQRDLLFVAEGDYVNRVETERGFEFTGLNDSNTQFYTADFKVYACG